MTTERGTQEHIDDDGELLIGDIRKQFQFRPLLLLAISVGRR